MDFGLVEVFRIFSILAGILIAYFTYMIYKFTKGGSKAWMFIAITGVTLGVWGSLQVIFLMFFDIRIIRIITGIIFLPLIALGGLFSSIELPKDMDIKIPKFLNIKNAKIYSLFIFLILLIYNLLTPFTNILTEILSIAHILIFFYFIPATYGFYFVWKGTRLKEWCIMSLASFLIVMGIITTNYTGVCCENNLSNLCELNVLDYVSVLPLPCIESLLSIALKGAMFLLFGEILYLISFYLIWRSMKC